MPMPKVSPEHLHARRNQILDAATLCFARNGVRETTVSRICAQAGLSTGAVYRYFRSKADILDAVYARARASNTRFGSALASAPDPLEALLGMVGAMVGFIDDPALRVEHHLSIQVHAAALSDATLARSYVRTHQDVIEQLAPLLRALQAEGRIRPEVDVDYALWVILCTYQGLRVQRMLDDSLDTARFATSFRDMVQRTLVSGS